VMGEGERMRRRWVCTEPKGGKQTTKQGCGPVEETDKS
jgi:hypothetical protein